MIFGKSPYIFGKSPLIFRKSPLIFKSHPKKYRRFQFGISARLATQPFFIHRRILLFVIQSYVMLPRALHVWSYISRVPLAGTQRTWQADSSDDLSADRYRTCVCRTIGLLVAVGEYWQSLGRRHAASISHLPTVLGRTSRLPVVISQGSSHSSHYSA